MNRDLAQTGAEVGALVAASHAERESEGWTDQALQFFELYAQMQTDGFMTEDVRSWAEKIGFPPPPDSRAWGYVAKTLARKGVVVASGHGKQRSSNCHGSFKTIWKLNRN